MFLPTKGSQGYNVAICVPVLLYMFPCTLSVYILVHCLYLCTLLVSLYTACTSVHYLCPCTLPVPLYTTCVPVHCLYLCTLLVSLYTACTSVHYLCPCTLPIPLYTTCVPVHCLYLCTLLVSLYTACTSVYYLCPCTLPVPLYTTCVPVHCLYLCILLVSLYTACTSLHCLYSIFTFAVKYLKFLRLRCNVKPSRGPFHFRAPSRIFYRTVRGMVPHKTKRGAEALKRLKVFEGIPPPHDRVSCLMSC